MRRVVPVLRVMAEIFAFWSVAVPFMDIKEILTGLGRRMCLTALWRATPCFYGSRYGP